MSPFAPSRRIFRAVVTTVVPDASQLDDVQWEEVDALVTEALQGRRRALRARLNLLLRFIQWMPLFIYGRPFTALDPERRVRFLTSLQNHRVVAIRLGLWGVRTLALLGFYGRATAAEAIGYQADRSGWEKLRDE